MKEKAIVDNLNDERVATLYSKDTREIIEKGCGRGISGNWKEKPYIRKCGQKNSFCIRCRIFIKLIKKFKDHNKNEFLISNRQVINMIIKIWDEEKI